MKVLRDMKLKDLILNYKLRLSTTRLRLVFQEVNLSFLMPDQDMLQMNFHQNTLKSKNLLDILMHMGLLRMMILLDMYHLLLIYLSMRIPRLDILRAEPKYSYLSTENSFSRYLPHDEDSLLVIFNIYVI